MRRVVASAPRSHESMLSIENNDKQLQERQQRGRTKTAQFSSVVLKSFFVLAALFVVADVSYLYGLNTAIRDAKKSVPAAGQASTNVVGNENGKGHMDTNDNNDKGPILAILEQAGIDTLNDLDAETMLKLPTWTQIQRMIGDKPIILGLETCQAFRDSIDPTVKFFGIAGTFNTGTNLLSELMIQNCQITERMQVYGEKSKGMRWQVPWGKHWPAFRRGAHVTSSDVDVPHENSLPLVTIRDPYQWMQSMCRHQYAARWHHTADNCPNVVSRAYQGRTMDAEQANDASNLVSVDIHYAENFHVHHNSLPHFWNDWYQLYLNAKFPRIMVRFEDLLFYGQEVTETLCACGGGVPREDRTADHFVHVSKSAKKGTAAHGSQKTDLVEALIKYGNDVHRLDNLTPYDLKAARHILDPQLMQIFGYSNPEM